MRLAHLDRRPVHHDEANQAVRCGGLLEQGRYTYDPMDHHGPTLYYLSLPLAAFQGGRCFADTTITVYRLVPALFGIALVLMPLLMADAFGGRAMRMSLVLAAMSPSLVYYSRFYIQETLLVFFTVAFLCCLWRSIRDHRLIWGVLAGICLGLMQATKETSILIVGSMAASGVAVAVWHRHELSTSVIARWRLRIVVIALSALCLSVVFYSSFFTNARGILDAWRAYGAQAWRGGAATVHLHPWYEYLHILLFWRSAGGPVWSEALIVLLALVGGAKLLAGAGLGEIRIWGRFFALYALLLVIVFSAIPYKTPWNALVLVQAFAVLAGVGGMAVFGRIQRRGTRIVCAIGIVIAVGHLAWQTCRASFRMDADPANPYVYAHTSRDFVGLVKRIAGVAKVHPAGTRMRIDVVTEPTDAWPLPWYLRAFTQVGYFPPAHVPTKPGHPVVVASLPLREELNAYLAETYVSEIRELRPGVFLLLAVRQDLWSQYLSARDGRR